MKTLLKNARILKMTNEPIFIGDIIVEDNKISYIGESKNYEEKFDKEIDCEKNLLMPGFKNAHAHSAMTFVRSHADDMSLQDWLFGYIIPREALLTEDDVYWLSQLAFLEYLTSGITAAFDMYYFSEAIARAAEDFGFREQIILSKSYISKLDKERIIELYKQNDPEKLANYSIGLHAEYSATEDEIQTAKELVKELKAPFFTHLAETKKEVEECKERHDGLTPAEFFDKNGFWDFGGGAYHCCYMTKNDLEIFKKRDLTVVTCPGSNTKLASGVPEIETMRENNIEIAIGTDGPASNNCLDMFREMFLVAGLQKLLRKNPAATPAFEILKMATVGSARAMGLNNADTLEVGKFADIIMIDLNRPNMRPINNISKNIVFSGSKDDIKMTMINGKILYENGEFKTKVSAEKIYEKCEGITARILSAEIN